jgi:hypothetical protein
MNGHFASYTPETMKALGQEFAAKLKDRIEFISGARNQTVDLLVKSRKHHQEAESSRRQRAGEEADSRHVFMSELRSGVHALLGRFELSRKERASDLKKMSGEFWSASETFRNRPGRQRGGAGPRVAQASRHAPATAEGRTSHSKKNMAS